METKVRLQFSIVIHIYNSTYKIDQVFIYVFTFTPTNIERNKILFWFVYNIFFNKNI